MPEARIDAPLRRAVEDAAHGCCEVCRSPERFAVQAFDVDPSCRGAGRRIDALLAFLESLCS